MRGACCAVLADACTAAPQIQPGSGSVSAPARCRPACSGASEPATCLGRCLCMANRPNALETSNHFDWMLKSGGAVEECKGLASIFKRAVGGVPFSLISYDHSK